jgi:hypothetical protein
MNEGSEVPDGESEQPQDEENDENGPQHEDSPFLADGKGKACASPGGVT